MDYKDLCADPLLQDLPFKIELDVWFCSEEGDVEFHSYEGRVPNSRLVPDMPSQIVRK